MRHYYAQALLSESLAEFLIVAGFVALVAAMPVAAPAFLGWRALVGLLLGLAALVRPMTLRQRPEVPAYVQELKRLPEDAVLDLASDAPQALFYETVHETHVFGYVAAAALPVRLRAAAGSGHSRRSVGGGRPRLPREVRRKASAGGGAARDASQWRAAARD